MTNSEPPVQSQTQNTGWGWAVTWKFNDSSFETLKTIAEPHRYKAGARIFAEGDRSDGMYLVVSGSANIVRKTTKGEDKIVGTVGEWQSFGEIGLLIDRPRHASVIAKTDLQVLKITPYALQLLHQSAPDMAFLMYQMLARSLAEQLLNTSEMQRPE